MKTTVLYAQVATSESRLLPGLLHYQLTALKLFCHKNNITILKIYNDTISNKTMRRPGLQALLKEVESREVTPDMVLVHDWYALSQYVLPTLKIVDRLHYKNVDVRATEDFDLQTFGSLMFKFKTSDPKEAAELQAKNIFCVPIYDVNEL